MNRNSWLRRGVLLFIAFLAFGKIAMAQDTASLRGTVTDESGGVIIGAKVILTNTKTNVPRASTSGNDGGSVSYTHLDVYKRQRPGRFQILEEIGALHRNADTGTTKHYASP